MPARKRDALVLVAVLTSIFVLPLSITGASTALPAIQAEFGGGLAGTQWVVNAYNACFAAFLVSAGSVADAIGRRRVYTLGVGLFCVSGLSVLLVQDIVALVVLRTLGGVGAAAVVAGGAAILTAVFEGPARARAFGLLGTVAGAGTAFGPAAAGLLIDTLDWRSAFAAPAVVAGAVLLLVPLLPPVRGTGRRVDLLGGALFTAALLTLITALVEGPARGPVLTVGALAVSFLLFAVFALVERGRRDPLVDVAVLANRRFVAYALAAATFMVVLVPLLVYLPSYLIAVVGLGPAQAGLWLLMLTVPTLVLPAVGAELAARLPHTAVVIGALALVGAGAFTLTTLGPDATPLRLLVPFLLIGSGVGLTNGLIDGLALGTVPAERAGTAAGVFNASRLTLETVSLAGAGAVLAVLTGGSLSGAAFTDAFHVVGLALGGCVVLVVAVVAVLGRGVSEDEGSPAAVD
ncbi:MFS transporter [Nocardiopsis lucentensis]|uniref:MFS transporter n=1 Tax=Nocardiopsis lucentensis TaxID=53441 RepID=UPI000348C597|nr:MFS transporter [Nocardiopsis lucentensis]